MADELLTDKDDDEIEIVEVDELPAPGATPAPKEDPADKDDGKDDTDEDDDDEDDGEDKRLAGHDEDDDEDSPQRKKRLKRRQLQKEAKERTLREMELLRRENAEFRQRLGAVETTTIAGAKSDIERRIEEVQKDIRQADLILAKAIEAGNGEDAATALRLRDEAKAAELDLRSAAKTFEAPRPAGAPDPRVAELATRWTSANPWYRRDGSTEESAIVNAIDNRMVAEGYNPATVEYWNELTSRVKKRLGTATPRRESGEKDPETPGRKKAPPLGNGRDHAPASTRKEVYVTPDRKQAMIDAGIWDDPVRRNKMLKAYAEFDRDQSSGR